MRLALTTAPLLLSVASGFGGEPVPATTDQVKQGGITWHFAKAVPVGRFVNGDWYVIGPVTVTAIDPAPTPERNGAVLNVEQGKGSSFDSRINNHKPTGRAALPIAMQPGDALISSISAEKKGVMKCLFDREMNLSPVLSYSVLTCLPAAVPEGTFRPGYADRQGRTYRAADLQTWRLHRLPRLEGVPDPTKLAGCFRQPWLDVVGFCFANAAAYQPQYAREIARAEGAAVLLLNCDFSDEEKRVLLINFVQYGIDLWSIIRDGKDSGWAANGGHGSGRKLAIVFAGTMLGDAEMASPSVSRPNVRFGQDMQTSFVKDMPEGMRSSWTGDDVVYTGHRGLWNGQPVSNTSAQQPYEHLQPRDWTFETFHYPGRSKPSTQYSCELYRRVINSPAWVPIALAGRIMHLEKSYAHDAFFAYCDRWMGSAEKDAQFREEIMKQIDVQNTKHDFREEKFWAGRVHDPWFTTMWQAYRDQLPPEPQPR